MSDAPPPRGTGEPDSKERRRALATPKMQEEARTVVATFRDFMLLRLNVTPYLSRGLNGALVAGLVVTLFQQAAGLLELRDFGARLMIILLLRVLLEGIAVMFSIRNGIQSIFRQIEVQNIHLEEQSRAAQARLKLEGLRARDDRERRR
ncbi:MAG: hypothetical protein AAGE01_15465 [Pseudomonadota bacterium]